MTITNFGSGEIQISDDKGHSLKLDRESANRLVLAARMHTVDDFLKKVPFLVTDAALLNLLLGMFEGKNSSERWTLKEKIARLQTLAKGYQPKHPAAVVEKVTF